MLSTLFSRRFAAGLGLTLVLGAGLLTSCDDDTVTKPAVSKADVVEQYSDIVYYTYLDSRDAAVAMRTAFQTLVTTPTEANLTAARNAYIAARKPYEQTEAFRFYGGPIDGTVDNVDGPEGLMNGWPLDENYIDYTTSSTNNSIINDAATYPSITKATLEGLNQGGGSETNISTGYHAIEFLLWGQDLSTTTAGVRPYTDFVTGANGTGGNQARRGQYLLAAADLLVDNLNYLVTQWTSSQANYRKALTGMPADSALLRIFTGLGEFTTGELYGERMEVAYVSQEQEDEHSCFSDQTHNDFVLGQKSIDNVYYGRYTRSNGTVVDGVGLNDLVAARSTTANPADANVQAALTKSAAAVQAIATRAATEHFDQQIATSGGRPVVKAAIDAGKEQGVAIAAAAKALGLTI
jgi:putative iron-regulated protein